MFMKHGTACLHKLAVMSIFLHSLSLFGWIDCVTDSKEVCLEGYYCRNASMSNLAQLACINWHKLAVVSIFQVLFSSYIVGNACSIK